ncbi:MAG: hypothetical protein EOP48_27185 [Sphingobacteriales bacterium]|nr:MAG: hypothetical protein EOP48_27185 [Sphingobacteriales bacterium]
MAYNEEEIYFNDINWYFADKFNRICIAASAGGAIPQSIMANNVQNDLFHQTVMEMPVLFNTQRNPGAVEFLQGIDSNNLDRYFENFESLAGRGLYAYDRVDLEVPESGIYLLIAYPIYDTNNDNFPFNSEELRLIPKIDNTIIHRRYQQVLPVSFEQNDLIKFIQDGPINFY